VTFANLAGLWFLLAMIPIVLLHILKPRRVEAVISSQLLWSDGSAGSTAASPWQRLRPSLPLLLQLLAVAALAIALANPVSRTATALASHTVVVVDTSASMAALDGTPTRLDSAKSDALALWDALPTDATISLVSAGPTPRVLLTASRDQAAYEAAVRSIRGTDGPADLAAAMSLADGLETPERTIGIVLVSDGQHPADELATLPLGVAHRLIGSDDVNRAITDLVVVPDDDGLEATVTLRATGGPAVTAPLRFDVDGRTAEVIDVEIPAEGPAVVTVDLPQGERVIARLGGEDLLAIDNTAYAVARQRRTSTVAVVGEVDTFLQALLVAAPGIAVVDPAEQTPDVVIYNRTAVPDDVARPFLAIVPPGGVPGVEVVGEVDAPIPTLVRTNHPILAGLDLSSLRIASAQRVEAPTAETLIGAEAAPLVARGTRVGVPFIYFAFDVARSTLPLDVSFPVMGERIIAELAGAGSVPRTLKVGDGLRPPVGQNITVADPTGTERSVPIGGGTITVDRPGFWSIESTDRAAQTVAVQLPTRSGKRRGAGSPLLLRLRSASPSGSSPGAGSLCLDGSGERPIRCDWLHSRCWHSPYSAFRGPERAVRSPPCSCSTAVPRSARRVPVPALMWCRRLSAWPPTMPRSASSCSATAPASSGCCHRCGRQPVCRPPRSVMAARTLRPDFDSRERCCPTTSAAAS